MHTHNKSQIIYIIVLSIFFYFLLATVSDSSYFDSISEKYLPVAEDSPPEKLQVELRKGMQANTL